MTVEVGRCIYGCIILSIFVYIFEKSHIKKFKNKQIFITQYNAAFSLSHDSNLPVLMGALKSRIYPEDSSSEF